MSSLSIYVHVLLAPTTRNAYLNESSSDSDDLTVQTPLLDISSGLVPPAAAQPVKKPPLPSTANIQHFDTFFGTEEPPSDESSSGSPGDRGDQPLRKEPKEENLLRMNTSVKLNNLIVERSHDASLVIVNLPAPPTEPGQEENCIFIIYIHLQLSID
jgi:hypothetical protein